MRDSIATAQLNYRYPLINMYEIDYPVFMAQNTPDVLVMAILCDFKDSSTKEVEHKIICRLMEVTGLSKSDLENLKKEV